MTTTTSIDSNATGNVKCRRCGGCPPITGEEFCRSCRRILDRQWRETKASAATANATGNEPDTKRRKQFWQSGFSAGRVVADVERIEAGLNRESGQPEVPAQLRPSHTLSNFRVEYVKPDYSRGHSFEPRCAILADDAALGGVEVRVFDVPDPDESQRVVAEWACGVMNRHEELLITLNQIRLYLTSPAIDAESMEEMRGVVNRALAGRTD